MAILEEAPRSATAIALDEVKALEFNRENFEILMQGQPQIALKPANSPQSEPENAWRLVPWLVVRTRVTC